MRILYLAALCLFLLLERRRVIVNVNAEIADRRQNRCLHSNVPAIIGRKGRFTFAFSAKGDRRSAGQNVSFQDVERDGLPLIRQGDIISTAIQGGYHYALRWGAQRVENQQAIFLSAGGGQGFYHQVPQAVAQLFGLLQPMQYVAVGGIAITAADRVVGMASQQLLPERIDHREVDRNPLMASHSDCRLQLPQDELLHLIIFLFYVVAHGADRFMDAGVARRFQLPFPAFKLFTLRAQNVDVALQRTDNVSIPIGRACAGDLQNFRQRRVDADLIAAAGEEQVVYPGP